MLLDVLSDFRLLLKLCICAFGNLFLAIMKPELALLSLTLHYEVIVWAAGLGCVSDNLRGQLRSSSRPRAASQS